MVLGKRAELRDRLYAPGPGRPRGSWLLCTFGSSLTLEAPECGSLGARASQPVLIRLSLAPRVAALGATRAAALPRRGPQSLIGFSLMARSEQNTRSISRGPGLKSLALCGGRLSVL